MTFTPTPKADLLPVETLAQEVASRLYWAEADVTSHAAAIADIYSRLPGSGGEWRWAGTPANTNPGSGRMSVIIVAGNNRTITINKTDALGAARQLQIAPGSTIILTDDPTTPPVTAFRQYLVTSELTDQGSWVRLSALRVSTFGTQTTPAVDESLRLLFR